MDGCAGRKLGGVLCFGGGLWAGSWQWMKKVVTLLSDNHFKLRMRETDERCPDEVEGHEDRKKEKDGGGGWRPMLWAIVLFTGVGLATDNVGLWLPVGIAIGMAWQGFVRMGKENEGESEQERPEECGEKGAGGEKEES